MTNPKLWRGQTLDARSVERRREFLAAGEQLLGTAGAGAVTMRAVVRLAGLSPRYFYESFASREELLTAVYDRVEATMVAHLAAVDVGGTTRETVRNSLISLREFFAEDPGRARILLREPLADDVLREHSSARVPAFAAMVAPLLGTTPTPRPDSSSWAITATAVSGALIALYLDYVDGRLDVEPDRMIDAAVDVVFGLTGLES